MRYVYKVENIVTGEFYVGETSNIIKRMNQHKKRAYSWKRIVNGKQITRRERMRLGL